MAFWRLFPFKQIWISFTWTTLILYQCFCIFIWLPILILIIIIIMIIFIIAVAVIFDIVIAIIISSFSILVTFFILVFIIYRIYFYWIFLNLNEWRSRTLFKVDNKDTETVSVSLMGTLNSVCLIYSSNDLLSKWNYYILPLTIISFIL